MVPYRLSACQVVRVFCAVLWALGTSPIMSLEIVFLTGYPTSFAKYQTGAVQPGCVACSGAEGTERELQCGPSGPCLTSILSKLLRDWIERKIANGVSRCNYTQRSWTKTDE
eukprot:scaffold6793_cov175-Skeletonema_marinoi.AAC.1